jgi:hypothetical protein
MAGKIIACSILAVFYEIPKANALIEAATARSDTTAPTGFLLNLSTELHLQIFEYLDPVFLTCLGLTCKTLYAIYKQLHGIVGLDEVIFFHTPLRMIPIRLWHLLYRWISLSDPRWDWVYNERVRKFRPWRKRNAMIEN